MSHLDMTRRPSIERGIVGALRSAIAAHGPVTIDNVSSAAKRIIGELKQQARQHAREGSPSPVDATTAYVQGWNDGAEDLIFRMRGESILAPDRCYKGVLPEDLDKWLADAERLIRAKALEMRLM